MNTQMTVTSLKREELAEKYRSLYNQMKEKICAEWFVYRNVCELLSGKASITKVRKRLSQLREECLGYAARNEYMYDSQYGTYGAYMMAKVKVYDSIITEVEHCQNH